MEEVSSKAHDGRCGAKTRAGTPCQQKAGWGTDHVGEGRCKLHGGKSTGPKNRQQKSKDMKGNKNGVRTGELESIVFDYLSDEEKDLLRQIDLDELKQTENELKLTDIRLRRMMGRIAKLQQENETVVETIDIKGSMGNETTVTTQDTLSQIQNIEEAVTRVQSQKLRLIKTKAELVEKLEKDKDAEDKLKEYFLLLGDEVDNYEK